MILQPALNVVRNPHPRHAERLPAEITVVHGVSSGPVWLGDKPVLSQSRPAGRCERWEAFSPGGRGTGRPAAFDVFLRVQPHAVLAEYGPTGVHALEACRLAGVPLVVHFHGFDASRQSVLRKRRDDYQRLFQGLPPWWPYRRPSAQANFAGARPEKVHYCPYGVKLRRFSGASPSASPPVFLAVGRFVEKKARLHLAGFSETFRTHPQSRLRMIGDGPLLGPCRDLAAAFGIVAAVTFLGSQPHEVVAQECATAGLCAALSGSGGWRL